MLDFDLFFENKYCNVEMIIKILLELNNCRVYYISIKGELFIYVKLEVNEKIFKLLKYFLVC